MKETQLDNVKRVHVKRYITGEGNFLKISTLGEAVNKYLREEERRKMHG